jgi:hypothetical protein
MAIDKTNFVTPQFIREFTDTNTDIDVFTSVLILVLGILKALSYHDR